MGGSENWWFRTSLSSSQSQTLSNKKTMSQPTSAIYVSDADSDYDSDVVEVFPSPAVSGELDHVDLDMLDALFEDSTDEEDNASIISEGFLTPIADMLSSVCLPRTPIAGRVLAPLNHQLVGLGDQLIGQGDDAPDFVKDGYFFRLNPKPVIPPSPPKSKSKRKRKLD